MPRHSREQSATGIYHVMLKGVNRQSIFEDDEDCIKLINLLRNLVQRFDDKGRPLPALCTIYAYCLMDNHIHLLVKEQTESISTVIKRVAVSYAYYFNRKYSRNGHLLEQLARIRICQYIPLSDLYSTVGFQEDKSARTD